MKDLSNEFLKICYEARIGEPDKAKLWGLIMKAEQQGLSAGNAGYVPLTIDQISTIKKINKLIK